MDEIVEAVCRLPLDHRSRNLSPVELVRQSGCLRDAAAVSVDRLLDCLVNHPRWVDSWFEWSADNRSTPEWWLSSEASGEYRLGYYDPANRGQPHPLVFTDKARACAEFISRYVEQVAYLVERVDANRGPGETDLDVALRLDGEGRLAPK
jgi:hypothetical protein